MKSPKVRIQERNNEITLKKKITSFPINEGLDSKRKEYLLDESDDDIQS
jgi:hypothetical protein